jgi:DNA-binding transcriptional regulator YiaG
MQYSATQMRDTSKKLQLTLNHILFSVQLTQKRRISYSEMAEIAGVSHRTFAEWMRGACSPSAVEAVLRMLSMLPCEEIEKAIEIWRVPVVKQTQTQTVRASGGRARTMKTGVSQKKELQDRNRHE